MIPAVMAGTFTCSCGWKSPGYHESARTYAVSDLSRHVTCKKVRSAS